MRPTTPRLASVLLIALFTVLPGHAEAQPGTVLGFTKLASPNLGAAGLTLHDLDEFGDAVAYLGDLDGAGPSVAAMAVAAPLDDTGGGNFGAVHVLFLNGSGSVLSFQKIAAATGGFTGTLHALDEFGSSVASLGDIDGAGGSPCAIAVGVIGDDTGGEDHGAVYVLRLNSNGTVMSTQKITSGQVGVPATAAGNGEEFGGAVAGLGDLDGAGPAACAMAVGAIGDDAGGTDRGATFIVYLNSSGAFVSSAKIASNTGNFNAVLDNLDAFGSSAGDLGDLDGAGPGVRSLAVGAVEDGDGAAGAGAVYLLHLNANGTVNTWSKISRTAGGFSAPLLALDNFGTAVVALGDLDGSGPSTAAIAVSAPGDDGAGLDRGAVYILFLNAAGSVLSHQEISSSAGGSISAQLGNGDEFGSALATLGDLDGAGAGALTLVSGVGFDDDGGTDRGATYQINLSGGPKAPVVSAPATATVAEFAPLTVNVTASDADGPEITSLTATGLPAGATFTPDVGNTSGTLTWTPNFKQSGTYTVTFTASNTLSGSASTQVTVTNVDRAPVVIAAANAVVAENTLLIVPVTASDLDGQAITSLTAANLPAGATFTPGPGNTSGTLQWTPGTGTSGSYTVTFTALNALSGSCQTQVLVGGPVTAVGSSGPALKHPTLAPSPVHDHSTLEFVMREAGPVEVDLLDLSGRRVRHVMSAGDVPPGPQHVAIDARDDHGERLPSGVYLYLVHAAHDVWTGRLVVTR